jgi:hypothetical protein
VGRKHKIIDLYVGVLAPHVERPMRSDLGGVIEIDMGDLAAVDQRHFFVRADQLYADIVDIETRQIVPAIRGWIGIHNYPSFSTSYEIKRGTINPDEMVGNKKAA